VANIGLSQDFAVCFSRTVLPFFVTDSFDVTTQVS
jgi:hypothetical protein